MKRHIVKARKKLRRKGITSWVPLNGQHRSHIELRAERGGKIVTVQCSVTPTNDDHCTHSIVREIETKLREA